MEDTAAPLCCLTSDYWIVGGMTLLLLLCIGVFAYWVGVTFT